MTRPLVRQQHGGARQDAGALAVGVDRRMRAGRTAFAAAGAEGQEGSLDDRSRRSAPRREGPLERPQDALGDGIPRRWQ